MRKFFAKLVTWLTLDQGWIRIITLFTYMFMGIIYGFVDTFVIFDKRKIPASMYEMTNQQKNILVLVTLVITVFFWPIFLVYNLFAWKGNKQ